MTSELAVRRVETDHGSHIEPPLDQSWSDLEKLRWHAAVLYADTGIRVHIAESRFWVGKRRRSGYYDVGYKRGSNGPMTFDRCWAFINGVDLGARLAADMGGQQ